MDRRTFLKAAGITGITGLAGCTGGPTEDGNGSGTDTSTDGTGNSGKTNVAVVYATGGLGDGSFNDQAQQGLQRAKQELNVASEHSQPSNVSDFAQVQRQYAQSSSPAFDLVCCIGALQKDALAEIAPQFPKQKFMLVDQSVDEKNVESYQFREEQGSFQIGHLAGLLTKMEFSAGKASTNGAPKVGFVGGEEIPLIKKFEAGYKAGVKHAGRDITVNTNYVGSFNDIASGKETALTQYNDGADIIYHASGNTGTGVFQAAQEVNRYALGVDSDQSKTKSNYADFIPASMVKHVDVGMFNAIKHVVNDEFKGGTGTNLGLEQGGVETVYGTSLGSDIPDNVKSKLNSSKNKITSGEITVPTKPSNV